MIGLVIIVLSVLIAIFAEQVAPMSYFEQTLADKNVIPVWVSGLFPTLRPKSEGGYTNISDKYALGADSLGRDILSRLIHGTRISLSVAVIAPLISLLIGVPYGLLSGYSSRRVDNLMMRFVDIMYAFPTILLIILLMAFFRADATNMPKDSLAYALRQIDQRFGGLFFIFLGIGITSWMGIARLVRGQVLSLRRRDFVEAAESIGAQRRDILFKHILPNVIGPIIIAETLAIPGYISYEAFLSFIGLGVNRPMPSWGSMIAEGSTVITTYPHQALFPAAALFVVMFAFNFLGDGLRDALDPRSQKSV
jgi:oligopeptide transport system permease protein